jgi:hypothetical protein
MEKNQNYLNTINLLTLLGSHVENIGPMMGYFTRRSLRKHAIDIFEYSYIRYGLYYTS